MIEIFAKWRGSGITLMPMHGPEADLSLYNTLTFCNASGYGCALTAMLSILGEYDPTGGTAVPSHVTIKVQWFCRTL